MSPKSSLVAVLLLLAGLPFASPALAQMGPGPGSGSGMPPMGPVSQPPEEQKPEGPAEAAPPEDKGGAPALQPLPAYPGEEERKLQFFEVHGYLRFRTYLFHNFNLDLPNLPNLAAPYAQPLVCKGGEDGCGDSNLGSANMRLRIEPTINVSEDVRVRAQIDVFDNLVLGATPEGTLYNGFTAPGDVPVTVFSGSQVTPQTTRNSLWDSVRAKRAWAEVRTPLGELRFGRMPNHWGMGMFINNGDCLDCDYGRNADRIMFASRIPGINLLVAAALDWAGSGPNSSIFSEWGNRFDGQPIDAEDSDDVNQYVLVVGKIDKPEDIRDKVDRGGASFNGGLYLVYRTQERDIPAQTLGGQPGTLVNRDAWAVIPDIWAKLEWRKLRLEFEGVGIFGRINSPGPLAPAGVALDVRKFGFVLKGDYRLLHDALKLGLEVGFASGDQAEAPDFSVDYRRHVIQQPPGDTLLANFAFDPDYHVDMILFRRLIGTVTNATYFKPWVSYDIVDTFQGRLDLIYSLANVPVATPGNSVNYGVELDVSIGYRNVDEGFFAGVAYAVLFPLGALGRPEAIFGVNAHDTGIAQHVETRLAVRF